MRASGMRTEGLRPTIAQQIGMVRHPTIAQQIGMVRPPTIA